MLQPIIVIGIAGPTNAGKSTLAKIIHETLSCKSPILCQDDFARNRIPVQESDTAHDYLVNGELKSMGPCGWKNWECLETISTEDFITAIQEARVEASFVGDPVLIVEGFLLFADSKVTELIDLRLFLEIPEDICYQR
jgi:uridine kinase